MDFSRRYLKLPAGNSDSRMGRSDIVNLFRGIRTGDRQAIARLDSISNSEWHYILKDLDQLGLSPLFYRYAAGDYLKKLIPEEVEQSLQELYFLHGARNMVLYNDFRELTKVLSRESIRIIALKGVHLAEAVYEETALRPMSDIDILAKEEDLSKIENLLLGMGYGPTRRPSIREQCRDHHHLIPFTKAGSPSIEVHWGLTRSTNGFLIDMDGIWARAKEVEISGCKVLALSNEDLLLHLCLHFSSNHKLSILEIKNLSDISEVIGRFGNSIDWERLVSLTKRSKTGRFVYCSLILSRNIFGTVIPPEVLAQFHHTYKNELMVDTVMNFVLTDMQLPLALPNLFDRLEKENRFAGRIKILSKTLLPSPLLLKNKYESAQDKKTHAGLYLRHWLELLTRSCILLGNMAFRTKKANPAMERRRKAVLINNWLNESVK
jgi:hypothetical protein